MSTLETSSAISPAVRSGHGKGFWQHALSARFSYDTILRGSLITLLLYGSQAPLLDAPLRVISCLLLAFPPLLHSRALWWILVCIEIVGNATAWHTIDNHKYLITYWSIGCAISLSLSGKERIQYLQVTARVLVGLVFAFAVLWKLLAGEYLNGSFLYVTFLTDNRLRYVTLLLTDLSGHDLDALTRAFRFATIRATTDHWTLPVFESPLLAAVTFAMSWLTILGEGAVSITNLMSSERLYELRHGLLWWFILLTYLLLPVMGFAFMLTLLGFAQCNENDTRRRLHYMIAFVLIHLTLVPWQRMIATRF